MSSPSPPPPPDQSLHPSTQYKVEEIVTTVRVPIVRPKPAFQRVLQLGGSTGETYTMSEIIDIVKTYIEERKLYDEQDPRIVYCQNDPLGEALNVTSFTISEALKLFWENCNLAPDSCLRIKRQVVATPVDSASATENSNLTSTVQTEQLPTEVEEEVRPPEKPNVSLTASQPSTSITSADIEEYERGMGREIDTTTVQKVEDDPKPSTSLSVLCDETDGSESPWSYQVMVERRDSSSQQRVRNHDSLVVECTSDTFSVEYELVSSSDAELVPNMVDNDESEASSSNLETTEVYVVCQESDIEYLADYSDTDSDSDAELSSEDKWQCHQCKFKNCALYRNCERCWSIRPGWLPTPSGSGIGKDCGEDDHGNKCVTNTDTHNTSESKIDSSLQKVASVATAEEVKLNDSINSATVYSQKESLSLGPDLCHSQDSAIGSLVSSQEHPEDNSASRQDKNCQEANGAALKHKREDSSDWSDSNEAIATKRCKKDLAKDADLKISDPCVICLTRSKTASIIHGKTGHQVCCYRCAKRLKQQRKSCPICRRPIQKVIRNFF